MVTEVKIKKWGNSLAIILPPELVEKRQLKENEVIALEVYKKENMRSFFGTLPGKKSGQAFKDMVKKGWTK